ncbi:hypothetical protein CL616_05215 [archaeon]|nr:hypothetical protein [archaeon]|tara:strand:- start:692 stop:1114 length:423 start_codon:yes stop_codon:yes gene_type:complete
MNRTTDIYLLCPVTNLSPSSELSSSLNTYVNLLEYLGYSIHFPNRDLIQDEEMTFLDMIRRSSFPMSQAKELHIYWDSTSQGSKDAIITAATIGENIERVILLNEAVIKDYAQQMGKRSYEQLILDLKELKEEDVDSLTD